MGSDSATNTAPAPNANGNIGKLAANLLDKKERPSEPTGESL
jgi:hypothetical protein